MHLPSSSSVLRDRSFYAKFYSRPPSEIEIIDKTPTSSYMNRTLSESPTTLTPNSDLAFSATSGFFSSSECSSSESTSSYTKRRRTTAPIIQERLNTYESACVRPILVQHPTLNTVKQKLQSLSRRSPPSLVNSINPLQRPTEQINATSIEKFNATDIDRPSSLVPNQIQETPSSTLSRINEQSILLDSSKRYLSKSTSQLCDSLSMNQRENGETSASTSSSHNILDIIQEELSEIRRTDHDLKNMFLSIYGKIQNIQQMKSSNIQLQKGQRYYSHNHDRPSRSITHSCYSSNSDIRRLSCTHHHHTRKYSLHSVAALRHRINHVRASSTADNDSYVDTDSSSSLSDSGTCSSPVYNEPCVDD